MSQELKLYSWNVNGIRAVIKKGTFESFVEEHLPDILCLQEIKAQEDDVELEMPQYIEYWHSAPKRGYSGTAILSRKDPIQVIRDIPDEIAKKFELKDSFGDPNREGRVIAAEFENFWLVNVYTPNSKPDLSRIKLRYEHWDPAFLTFCKELEKSKPVIMCGDFNVAHTEEDLANPGPNKGKHGFTDEEREGFQNILDAGYIDSFRMFKQGNGYYSYWNNWANARVRNIGWRIDCFFVSKKLHDQIKAADIHADIMGSDHCPVSLTLKL